MFSKEGRTVSLCQTAFCLKLKMTRQVLERLTALIMCHVKLHLFPRVKERMDHNLDLLLISQIIPSSLQLVNHCLHFLQMLLHGITTLHLEAIKFQCQLEWPWSLQILPSRQSTCLGQYHSSQTHQKVVIHAT